MHKAAAEVVAGGSITGIGDKRQPSIIVAS